MTDYADFINLKPGKKLTYYIGEIGYDAQTVGDKGARARYALKISHDARKAGIVTLCIKRVDWKDLKKGFEYIAIGIRRPPEAKKKPRPSGPSPFRGGAPARNDPRQVPEDLYT